MRRKIVAPKEPKKCKFQIAAEEGRAKVLQGKRIAVVVDDCEHETESFLLPFSVFKPSGADGQVLRYSSFFSGEKIQGDIILLRSTREFAHDLGRLETSLRRLRMDNPDSTIVLCAYDPSVFRFAAPLHESGVIDVLDETLVGDLQVLESAVLAGRSKRGGA